MTAPVLIVGAGLAGLTCALHLERAGMPFLLLESSDAVGGRIRTDITPEGFRLDRGFQVLLSSYPELRREVCLENLDVRRFRSGAVIRLPDKSQTRLPDPFTQPWLAPTALFSPIGTLFDKLRVARLLLRVLRNPEEGASQKTCHGVSTLEFLRSEGWTEPMIQTFFVPFFGGVFLDRNLRTSATFFQFVFRHFALGRALLPNQGMQSLPEHLAEKLPGDRIRFNTRVRSLEGTQLTLETGERLRGRCVVLAVDAHSLHRLLPGYLPKPEWRSTTCTYFCAPESPAGGDAYLRLNACPNALAHNVCVPSDVAPGYAPPGRALVSVSTHGSTTLAPEAFSKALRAELRDWFGPQVDIWQHLRTYSIPCALPVVPDEPSPQKLPENLYVCGDHTRSPSLNDAMASGRSAAEMVLSRH